MDTLLILTILVGVFLIGFGYAKSKTWADKFRFTLIPISTIASIYFFKFIIGCWNFNHLGNLLSKENITSISQLQIIPLFLIEYCLIASIAICFCAWKKEGFNNLKKPGDLNFGLITGLISWLIVGLVAGLITGLIVGLVAGLITGLITITGLIIGLCGLIGGLVAGLIGGLSSEFYKDS